jgi:hypothetical protein
MVAAASLTAFVAVGCSSSSTGNPPPEPDASTPVDAPVAPPDAPAAVDSPAPSEGGGLPLGSMCTQASDCASGLCEPFRMQTVHLCTQPCTAATQATDCPNPPTAGTCTPNMYCRFN